MMNRWIVLLFFVACGDVQDADDVASKAQEIFVDRDCSPTSLQLFDEVGWHGRRICFFDDGTADLASHCRITLGGGCWKTWAGAVKSFKSGQDSGRFMCGVSPLAPDGGPGGPGPGPSYTAFSTFQAVFTADSCTQEADKVSLF